MEGMPVPPGFTRLTSFTLQMVQKDSPAEAPVQSVEDARRKSDKLRKSLRDRPWVNYNETYTISDSEDEEIPDQRSGKSLPLGVIRGCDDCEDCQKIVARWRPDGSHRPILDEAPVFHPTKEEFNDPMKYIESIQAAAKPYGICRIVPPSSWKPPPLLQEKKQWEGCKFSTRVQQIDRLQNRETGDALVRKKRRKTDATVLNQVGECFGFQSGPDFTLQSYKRYADLFQEEYFRSEADRLESTPSVDEIEGEFWRIVEKPTETIEVLYGADLDTASFGSGFPEVGNSQYVQSGWNLNNIPNIPRSMLCFESSNISGVKIPWLYVGMCLSSFCWHVEDHHLYSLNYMHMGAPKVWYGVPEKDAQMFEHVLRKHLPHLFEEQPDLLHNLVTQFSPSVLKQEGISVFRCVQNEGEFVLTLPGAYHSGFNCGFNCAEAVNLAPIDWFPHGQNAVKQYRKERRVTTISHDKLLIGAANEAVRALWNIFLLNKFTPGDLEWKRLSGDGSILAKTFQERKEAEKHEREHLCSPSQCQKMDAGFDAAVRECVFCHYDLYLSAVSCSSCPDKYACLMHAKELCLCNWRNKHFLFRYNDDELDILLDALRAKLSSIHRWGLNHLGLRLSACQYSRVQKEAETPVNRPNSTSEEMRDAASTGTSTQQQHRQNSGRISGGGKNIGTSKTEAVPTRKDMGLQEGPGPSAMAQDSDDNVATPVNRPTIAIEEMRDAADSSRTQGIAAAPTRNNVVLQEGPSSSARDRNSNGIPAQPHNLPRFVKIGKERTVEVVEYGTIIPHKLWSTKKAIFPKGFRSRVKYWSVLEANTKCDYVSEILDAGLVGPFFMVSVEANPSEVFVHVSPERCWELVVQKVNTINKIAHQEDNKKWGRPTPNFPLLKPGSIDGLEMFGLLESSVLWDLEALDTKRVSEYCRIKDQSMGAGTLYSAASGLRHQNPLVRRAAPSALADNPSLMLQELLKKANPRELRALENVLRDATSSSNSRQEAILLISTEIRSRQ